MRACVSTALAVSVCTESYGVLEAQTSWPRQALQAREIGRDLYAVGGPAS